MRKCLYAVLLPALFCLASNSYAAVQLVPVLSGLSNPVFVTGAGDGSNRLFILEQGGRIKVLQPGSTTPTIFLDITTRLVSGGERGLLGLAFHPDYPSNPRFYVNYTRTPDGATVIAEYQVSSTNPDVANPTETVLLTIAQPYANHNGGMLAFGSDGYLYIGMGDGGDSYDPQNRAQNLNELLGKILRIDVNTPNGSIPYSSPSTNPFFGPITGRDEIYAYGMRNPWRFSFDRLNGRLYVGDVGQGTREEVSVVTAGGNYGWRVWEGFSCTYAETEPARCTMEGYLFPFTEYVNGARCAVTGGYSYRGTAGTLPPDRYIFGDFCSGEIFIYQEGSPATLLLDTDRSISSFGEDDAGELYVVGLGGTIDRITNTTPPPPTCTYAISPTRATFGAAGGTGSVTVTAPQGCAWTATTSDDWIILPPNPSGSGNGTLTYSIATFNLKRKSRTGNIRIAGQTLSIKQSR